MGRKVISVIVFVFGLQFSNVYSQTTSLGEPALTDTNREALFQAITSTNRDTRLQAAIQLDGERNQLIQRLVLALNSTNQPKEKIEAVIVLGEYRAQEAVPILVDHLEWDDFASGSFFNAFVPKEESESKLSPVTSALRKIGLPALPALMGRIFKTSDPRVAKKCVVCCCLIEGVGVSRKRFEEQIKTESDQAKKEKLESALSILNSLKVSNKGNILFEKGM